MATTCHGVEAMLSESDEYSSSPESTESYDSLSGSDVEDKVYI